MTRLWGWVGAAALLLAACGSNADNGGNGGRGGAGGVGGIGGASGPAVPAQGVFFWTYKGQTITAMSGVLVNGVNVVGYRLQADSLLIQAITPENGICSLIMPAPMNVQPPAGVYPISGDFGPAVFDVNCVDPTAPPLTIGDVGGHVTITKSEPGDLEGTFVNESGTPDVMVGGFNLGLLTTVGRGPM
jgi:hypothetical protein